ncbi:MAG: tyrosine--tRNA ligase [Candidatus Eisenbacteria bacterium]|jgi:tyrosyl-tRNA synthetase|nr:tyrosine--tRNA ligase [Candidatus Eisenbacteria bacterium]
MNPIDELLTRGVTQAIDQENLRRRAAAGAPLRIKLGIDPTGPLLHLGRAVPLLKLRAFQDLGHLPVIVIGDFTGRIGDASDKDAERRMLSREEVEANMAGYMAQIGRILDMDRVEVTYNSDWLGTMSFEEVAHLANHFSVAEMLDRDNFSKRFQEGKRISLREFLYPLMQGYDSVAVRADVELGGNDQLFNLLAGRTIQRAYGQPPQDVITFGMLEGTDGRKMSTTYGNIIAMADPPEEQFGRVMRLKDELIIPYFELTTRVELGRVTELRAALLSGMNPMEAKLVLAEEIVTLYHGLDQARTAREQFLKVFRQRELPDEIPEIQLPPGDRTIQALLAEAALAPSRSEAGRLVRGGGVKVDGHVVAEVTQTVCIGATPLLVQVGRRRIARIIGSHG